MPKPRGNKLNERPTNRHTARQDKRLHPNRELKFSVRRFSFDELFFIPVPFKTHFLVLLFVCLTLYVYARSPDFVPIIHPDLKGGVAPTLGRIGGGYCLPCTAGVESHLTELEGSRREEGVRGGGAGEGERKRAPMRTPLLYTFFSI